MENFFFVGDILLVTLAALPILGSKIYNPTILPLQKLSFIQISIPNVDTAVECFQIFFN